jgi:hypothetical protein
MRSGLSGIKLSIFKLSSLRDDLKAFSRERLRLVSTLCPMPISHQHELQSPRSQINKPQLIALLNE